MGVPTVVVAWWIIIHTTLKARAAPVEHEVLLSGCTETSQA